MIIPERFREGEGTRLEFKRMLPSEDRKVFKDSVHKNVRYVVAEHITTSSI